MKKYVLSADIGKYETEITGRDLEGTKEDIKKTREAINSVKKSN